MPGSSCPSQLGTKKAGNDRMANTPQKYAEGRPREKAASSAGRMAEWQLGRWIPRNSAVWTTGIHGQSREAGTGSWGLHAEFEGVA